jgi:hypothetical protein
MERLAMIAVLPLFAMAISMSFIVAVLAWKNKQKKD